MSRQFALVADYAVYLCVRIGIFIVQSLPLRACQLLARWFAFVATDVIRFRRTLIDENIRHAFPAWPARRRKRLAKAMWEHIALMSVELVHAPRKINADTWSDYVTSSPAADELARTLNGRATILLSGHFGNFEVAGYLSGLRGYSTHAISKPLNNPFLDRYFSSVHAAHGQHVLPHQQVAMRVAQLLESGQCVALLADQFGGPRGVWIDFLGRPASYHKGPAVMSLSSGAPIVVGYTRRLDRPLHFETVVLGIMDPLNCDPKMRDVRAITEWYNGLLEQMVRSCPEQYWWVHRRWKGKPPASRTLNRRQGRLLASRP
jgi:KDO2-lipid IV(A) lauroyltransferase